jgi:CheY-like chemotaxis protein
MPTKEKRPASRTDAGPPRVLVAIPTSFQQEVVRFYLKDAGYQILGMVPSGADLLARAGDQQPEAVVLHESVAAEPGPGLIQELRKVTPSTKIVVLAAAPDEAWRGPARGADAFLEEGVGIASLKGVLAELCGATGIRPAAVWIDTDGQAAPAGAEDPEEMAPIPLPAAPGRGVLWYERFRGAAAAAILLLALFKGPQLFLAASPSSGPDGAVASGPLAGAFSSFNLLVASLQNGASPEVLMGEARDLSASRAAAVATGADVSDLDAAIAAQVPPLLKNVSPRTASTISAILGDLVPTAPPIASPSPSPVESPSPVRYGCQPCGILGVARWMKSTGAGGRSAAERLSYCLSAKPGSVSPILQ